MNPSPRYRLGVDIGGTFTDAILINESTGHFSIDKVLTTPADPSLGFIETTRRLADRTGLDPRQLTAIIHATTVATNALIERRGSKTALLITEGFRDILEIARQVRYELYNLQTEKPPPLAPRQRCLEIPERMDYRGEVLRPLEEDAVARAGETLRAQGIGSIAVCFLHAYRNPTHEQRAAEILQRVYPDAIISLSSEIAPEIREYWRASTTVTNAYIRPIVQRYLTSVDGRLCEDGYRSSLHVMQSSGGMMSAEAAKQRPIYMLESGPAAGVAAAAFVARLAGFPDAISFDMGGTTAKVGLIRGGQPSVRTEFEAGSVAGTGVGLAKGSGYPILAPVMDLVEVGAGGGSLAWIDAGGLLRVGPRSAGADPGPACYGRSGQPVSGSSQPFSVSTQPVSVSTQPASASGQPTSSRGPEPTVTDANLVLGRLQPDYFLGGELRLDTDAARRAIEEHCAQPLGMSVVEAAMGIVEIANAAMVQAMRLVSVQRGYDPRDFALVAFGGAGPVHANALAAQLGIPTVVVPPSPGVASALGMLASNVRKDYRATHLQPLSQADPDELSAAFRAFEDQAIASLGEEGFAHDTIRLERYLDMRYVGQSWKLPVTLPAGPLGHDTLAWLREQFDRQHEQQYGYAVSGEPVEIVTIGISALGLIPPLTLLDVPSGDASPAVACISTRPIFFQDVSGFVDAPLYDRYRLKAGNVLDGPAVIVETDATTVLEPGYSGTVGKYGTLLIRPTGAGVGDSGAGSGRDQITVR